MWKYCSNTKLWSPRVWILKSQQQKTKWNSRNWFQLLGASYHIWWRHNTTVLLVFAHNGAQWSILHLSNVPNQYKFYGTAGAQYTFEIVCVFFFSLFEINLYYINRLEYHIIFFSFFVFYFHVTYKQSLIGFANTFYFLETLL